MPDGAVFARRIHALKDDEQRMLPVCVKDLLERVESAAVFYKNSAGCFLRLVSAVFIGLKTRKIEPDVRLDQVGRLQFHGRIT